MAPLHIIAACSISKGILRKNDTSVSFGDQPDTAAFLHVLYQHIQPAYPKWYKMDRLSQLGILAAEWLLRGVDLPADPFDRAMVLQSGHGCLDTDLRFVRQLDEIPSPAVFVYTLPNIVIGEISIKFGFKGEQAMFMRATPDAGMLHDYVSALFAEGHTRCCVCGWVDVFDQELSATLFAVAAGTGDITFNKDNIQYYSDHEQR